MKKSILVSVLVTGLTLLGASAGAGACDLHADNSDVQTKAHASMANSMTLHTSQAHADDANVKTATLSVKGMMCSSCAKKVNNAVKSIKGVESVSIDTKTGLTQVKYDTASTSPDAMVAAIKAAGYEVKPNSPQL